MNSYFFNVSDDERAAIKAQHKKPYNGYIQRGFKPMDTTIYEEDFAKDKTGITIKGNELNESCPDCGCGLKENMCEQCGYKKTDINPQDKGDYSESLTEQISTIKSYMKTIC